METIDSLQIGKSLELFPDQIRNSFNEAYSVNIAEFSPQAVIISGMGGSSNAAKILEGIYENDFKTGVDIDIHNDYGLPIWVNKETLVIANSYSGNTEETLSSVDVAIKAGATIVAVTTGGKLKDMINEGVIAGAVVEDIETNPSRFPKSGLGVSFGALAGVLSKIGVIKLTKDELDNALIELIEIRKSWDAEAKAGWFADTIPVLFSGRPFLGSLNAGRNAICEIGRVFTLFFDFPEVNHVLVEATGKPEFVKQNLKYLFFESNFLHPRVKKRFEVTKKIFDEQGLTYSSYTLKGSSILSQALELAHYSAWVGYHLSILRNEDPGPEPWILKLKESLV